MVLIYIAHIFALPFSCYVPVYDEAKPIYPVVFVKVMVNRLILRVLKHFNIPNYPLHELLIYISTTIIYIGATYP